MRLKIISCLRVFDEKTKFLSKNERTLLNQEFFTMQQIKDLFLSVMTRLNSELKRDSYNTENFFKKWADIEKNLKENIEPGKEAIFLSLLHSDVEFALRNLTAGDINEQKSIHVQAVDPLVEELMRYWPAYQAAFTLMQGLIQSPIVNAQFKLSDPKIYEYHYPEIFSGILAVHLTFLELYAAFVSGQIPYNVLYAATQAIVENGIDADNKALKELASELVPFSLYVGIQMGYDPQLPVFYHSTLSYLFTRFTRSFFPQIAQTVMHSTLWQQMTEKLGQRSWSRKIGDLLQGMTSPQLSGYFNAQFLHLGSLWLFNQVVPQDAVRQYFNPKLK